MAQYGTGIVPSTGPVASQLNALTRRAFIPAIVVQIYQAYPTLALLMKNAQRAGGGLSQVTVPVQTGSFVTPSFMGYDGNFAQPTETPAVTNMEFNLSMLGTPVGFLGMEGLIQSTEAVVPILKAKMADIKTATATFMANSAFNQDNLTNPLAPFSLAQAYDNGTTYDGYGGLSRASNPTIKSTVATVGDALTRKNTTKYLMQCTTAAGGEAPDFAVLSPADWTTLQSDFMTIEQFNTNPTSRYGKDNVVNAGFRGIMLMDTPIFFDAFCPVGTGYLINSRYLAMYVHENAQFAFTGFKDTIANFQLAYIGLMLACYQIICTKPSSGMKLTGITGASF